MLIDSPAQLEDKYDAVVVGGGAGGMLAATMLAEAGVKVLIIEKGSYTPQSQTVPFGAAELRDRYKNAGITASLGAPTINYVEGSCLGGGSEVNSGLYHRISPEVLEKWKNSHQIEDFCYSDLESQMAINERELKVSYLPGEASRPSLKLKEGADELGWKSLEVPRWFEYDKENYLPSMPVGIRRSATETYLSRFLSAGGCAVTGAEVKNVSQAPSGDWRCEIVVSEVKKVVAGSYIFFAGGAVDTPFLLMKSGLGANIGKSLYMHPTVKVMAKFREPINSERVGVPVHQVKEFAPEYSFGCAISSPPFLVAQSLSREDLPVREVVEDWRHFFTYYAMTNGGCGQIRKLPFLPDPVVQYNMTKYDLQVMANAARDLSRLLLAAGAESLFVSDPAIKKINSIDELINIPNRFNKKTVELMTIHLMGSCPMGEDRNKCAVDSWGKLHGLDRAYIADTSIFAGPLGSNPQGTVMALVRRNIKHFLSRV